MSPFWKKVQDNAPGLAVALTVIALLVTVFSVPKLIEDLFESDSGIKISPLKVRTDTADPSIPDIFLSQLSDPQVIRPFPGFEVIRTSSQDPGICPTGKPIYGAGFEMEFNLSHDKKGDLPITVNSILIVHQFEPGPSKNLQLHASAEHQLGAGTQDPYQFAAILRGTEVEIEEWKWKDGTVIVPKGNDLLHSEKPRRIVLRNDAKNDVETIIGTIEVTDIGLYLVWLKISGVIGEKAFERETDRVCVYYNS